MSKYKEITIKWSYPVEYDRVLQSERMDEIGLYYVSRVFGGTETLLYIGKSINSFGTRLRAHKDNGKFDKIRGAKLVRLGIIVEPEDLTPYEMKGYINDAERTIIFCIANEMKYKQFMNVNSIYATYPDEKLVITNTGYRGVLGKTMRIPKKYDID